MTLDSGSNELNLQNNIARTNNKENKINKKNVLTSCKNYANFRKKYIRYCIYKIYYDILTGVSILKYFINEIELKYLFFILKNHNLIY